MKRHRVLVVDDSALIREVLSDVLGGAGDLEVVGTANDPFKAWEKIKSLRPDVLTLDIEMPRMDGLTFLERLMRLQPMPVVMVSKHTLANCDATVRALQLGAVDFATKPTLDIRRGTVALGDELIQKVREAARSRVARPMLRPPVPDREAARAPVRAASRPGSAQHEETSRSVVAIGASTGGVQALHQLLGALPADAPGLVVVQHMPAGFTLSFAERLDRFCRIEVREARSGDVVSPGLALIAPGGQQLEICRSSTGHSAVQIYKGAPVNRHRPSVDLLFESCATTLGRRAVGVLLTGMGQDGAEGLATLHRTGAHTIAQDEESCVVFGMPREAIALGAADEVLPLERIAHAILRRAPTLAARE